MEGLRTDRLLRANEEHGNDDREENDDDDDNANDGELTFAWRD
jgi:hypothetical protein